MKKTFKLLVSAALCRRAAALTFPVQALGKLDASKPVSLKIVYESDSTPVENASFMLWKVADVTESGPFELNAAFQDSKAVLPEANEPQQWDESAGTLFSWAVSEKIAPAYQAKTSAEGKAELHSIEQGLYLVGTSPVRSGNDLYSSAPFLICLPNRTEEGLWSYQVTARPKAVKKEPVLDLEVKKEWKSAAPVDSIEVSLCKDGQVVRKAALSKSTGWKYVFKDLDGSASWTVMENTRLDGWNVATTEQKGQIILTNSKKEDKAGTTVPFTGNWTPFGVLCGAAGLICLAAAALRSRSKNRV